MKTKLTYLLGILFFSISISVSAQIQFPHNDNNSSGAERVSNFGISGINNQRFEITNATVNNGQFLPALWAHNGSANYHALQIHATTTSQFDNGNSPLMMFIASRPQTVNLNAPSGTQFPWGNGGTQQTINTRPTFSWINGSNTAMLLSAQNNLGLSTTSPTARLDVNGTARVRNLPTTTNDLYVLTSDTNGNLKRQLKSTLGGGNDLDWLKVGGGNPTSINDNIYSLGRVGINVSSPTANLHTNGTVRFQNLANGRTPVYLLGTDRDGNVMEYSPGSLGGNTNCNFPNFLIKSSGLGSTTCSQIYDNGTNVGIGTTSPNNKLTVNGNIQSLTNTFLSDKKYKKNILQIDNALESILKLNGTTYNWRKEEYKDIEFTDKKQYGLIAQEVEKVLPDLVTVINNEDYSLNYTGLIPVLIEAVKEQQNQIIELNNKISDLKSKGEVAENVLGNGRTYFSSNYPNPFQTETTIEIFIEKNVKSAKIVIYDSNGSTISKYDIKERDRKTNLKISKNNLNSGVYFYTLITDDLVIGTKKMIVK